LLKNPIEVVCCDYCETFAEEGNFFIRKDMGKLLTKH
jgi:hypothetical protein